MREPKTIATKFTHIPPVHTTDSSDNIRICPDATASLTTGSTKIERLAKAMAETSMVRYRKMDILPPELETWDDLTGWERETEAFRDHWRAIAVIAIAEIDVMEKEAKK